MKRVYSNTSLSRAHEVTDDLYTLVGRPPQRLHQYFERQCDAAPQATAVVNGTEALTYAELDAQANRLAWHLAQQGIHPGATVGILLERSMHTYIALLGVLKAGAAFVPIDPSYPPDRVAFIATDAGLSALLTSSSSRSGLSELTCPALVLDELANELAEMPATRRDVSDHADALAYIIYTSGTTGRPKGVAVNHSNITNFLAVVAPIYGVSASDRVYQGMTIAFDFSIEEIWPTWMAGAALIAGPNDSRRIGPGLAEFLTEHRVSMLYCVPTLLATLDRDLPLIHTLVVGGEACPKDLVERWSSPGRRMLNTYGPTETTVTATWCELEPGRPVTIGRPLPGYRVYVLDEYLQQAPYGEPGEICIGGFGVAQGYVNRPDLTAAKFVIDPFEPQRVGARLYRSGDLGRFTANGEVEFLGRIDSQVKIRGYRIELGEIEAVLLNDPGVENAIVSTVPAGAPAQDLAAYITLRNSGADLEGLRERLGDELRRRLPAYMVPAYLEVLPHIPMLPSGKADRKALPSPVLPRLSARRGAYEAPATPLEERIASVWRTVFGREDISVEADFFTDLGGHSLFAAQVVSKLRQQPDFIGLGIADLYAHATVRSLARQVAENASPLPEAAPACPVMQHANRRVWTAGLAQFGLLYGLLAVLGAPVAFLLAAHGGKHSYTHVGGWDLTLPLVLMLLQFALPVALKWTLIGRFRPGSYPLWGSYYCRWWIVRKTLELSPLHLLAGSPLIAWYARLLGARIGRDAHISTGQLQLPDLIEIGDGAHIGYEVELQPFAVEGGYLHLAPVSIGAGAFVGTKAVILAGAQIGEHARVAEQTLVSRGQVIPAWESWAGSPSQKTETADPLLDRIEAQAAPPALSRAQQAGYLAAFCGLELLPMAAALPGLLLLARADGWGGPVAVMAATPFAGLLFVVTLCALVGLGKRIVMPEVAPGLYPLHSGFGLRKWIADKLMGTSLAFTNTVYATLYALPWLRLLGAKIGCRSEVSTVSHIDPDLLTLGDETFVADLASIGAAAFHRGYAALSHTEIGSRTFLGNASVVRGATVLPDNCLIGVASVAPDGQAQPGTSWLGSPAIFLPRRQSCAGFTEADTYRPRPTLVVYRLFVEFFRIILPPALLYLLGAMVTLGSVRVLQRLSLPALLALTPALYLTAACLVTLLVAGLKWLVVGRYRPRIEPLWAPFVRHSELITGLYESAAVPVLIQFFTGTPFIGPLLRLFGVNVGQRVYLETTYTTEFDLVRIGDDAAVGRAASLQTHLFEDRVMKMSTVTIGAGAAVGPRAVVLYDTTVGERTLLEGLSLVMKGEFLPPDTSWQGIPAQRG